MLLALLSWNTLILAYMTQYSWFSPHLSGQPLPLNYGIPTLIHLLFISPLPLWEY